MVGWFQDVFCVLLSLSLSQSLAFPFSTTFFSSSAFLASFFSPVSAIVVNFFVSLLLIFFSSPAKKSCSPPATDQGRKKMAARNGDGPRRGRRENRGLLGIISRRILSRKIVFYGPFYDLGDARFPFYDFISSTVRCMACKMRVWWNNVRISRSDRSWVHRDIPFLVD